MTNFIDSWNRVLYYAREIRTLGFNPLGEIICLLDVGLGVDKEKNIYKFENKLNNEFDKAAKELEVQASINKDKFADLANIFNKMFDDPEFKNYSQCFVSLIKENIEFTIKSDTYYKISYKIRKLSDDEGDYYLKRFEPMDYYRGYSPPKEPLGEFFTFVNAFVLFYKDEIENSYNIDSFLNGKDAGWCIEMYDQITKWLAYQVLIYLKGKIDDLTGKNKFHEFSESKLYSEQAKSTMIDFYKVKRIKTKLTVEELSALMYFIVEEISDEKRNKTNLSKIITNSFYSKEKEKEPNSINTINNGLVVKDMSKDLLENIDDLLYKVRKRVQKVNQKKN